jgi:hypothetical protein
LAASGNGSWVDVGLDVVSLATMGVGKAAGPGSKLGAKVFGKVFGSGGESVWAGQVRLAQQEVRRLGGIENARRAVGEVAQSQPWRKMKYVRASARKEYLARPAELAGSVWERASTIVRTGFTDPDLARFVDDMGRTAGDFPNPARIREAISDSQKWLVIARSGFGSSAAVGVSGVLERVPGIREPWHTFKDHFVRQAGSTW